MAAVSITVATPAYGEIFYTPYVQSLLRLQRAVHQRKWTIRHAAISYALVADARNFLLTHWFDNLDTSHLLFVDADMGFEPELIFEMIALNKPVVGVIYPRRQIDLKRLVALAGKGEKPERAVARAHDFIIRPLHGRQPRRIKGFMEVERCGTGVMLIRRDAITAMLQALPDINDTNARKTSGLAQKAKFDRLIRAFDTLYADGVPLSDDFAFCYRWQSLCKGELWACTNRAVTHIGLHKFSSRYSDVGVGKPVITLQSRTLAKPARRATTGNGKAKINARNSGTLRLNVSRKDRPRPK
jgi:hypothetical protein